MQDHVEGYLELSAKTKTYFATAVNLWDADFYIKVDDDVHVNIGIRCSYKLSERIYGNMLKTAHRHVISCFYNLSETVLEVLMLGMVLCFQ